MTVKLVMYALEDEWHKSEPFFCVQFFKLQCCAPSHLCMQLGLAMYSPSHFCSFNFWRKIVNKILFFSPQKSRYTSMVTFQCISLFMRFRGIFTVCAKELLLVYYPQVCSVYALENAEYNYPRVAKICIFYIYKQFRKLLLAPLKGIFAIFDQF